MSVALPTLTLTTEDQGDVAIVHCRGKLTLGVTDLLYTPVAQLVPKHRRIVLDLAELTHMDSMGIGILLRLYVHGNTHGCTIELRHLTNRIKELMIMANLLPVFTTVGEQNIRM
jgi:anti-anti-sigma factor